MVDVAERFKRTAPSKPSADRSAKPEPFAKPPKKYPRRVTLDLADDDYTTLRSDSFAGEVKLAELLRGLVALYRQDPKVAKRALREAEQAKD